MKFDQIRPSEATITHSAEHPDDHALEIIANANGYGDVKAIDIDYVTGSINPSTDEAAILVNIDKTGSTGGDIVGLEVLSTSGTAETNGLFIGAEVSPIRQISGVFADMTSALVNAVDRLTEFTTPANDIAVFIADNDTITIGSTLKFEELEFILSGVSSKNVIPTFEYSTGIGLWSIFTPVDGTNGLLNNGVMAWLDGDIPSWATGLAGEYLIRITRTANGSITAPIVDLAQIVSGTEYCWDKDGNLKASTLNLDGLTAYNDDTAAGVGGLVVGDVYQTTGAGAAPLNAAGILMIKQ